MRVPRIHVATTLAEGSEIELTPATAHHLLRVLRLPDGAALRLFNGDAGDWHATLHRIGRNAARTRVTRFDARAVESTLALTLIQGVSRGQRMDYTLAKSVELGVARIVPVVMDRSHAVPVGERLVRKQEHWHGVIAAAAAQCGRTRMPELANLVAFADWLSHSAPSEQPHILLDPGARAGPAELGTPRAITLLAGPEGGFSPAERKTAMASGCIGIRLGPRILRTETAAIAALAALQTLYGDFTASADGRRSM